MKKLLHDKTGFTLIELLVVIGIIAILVVVVVVAINPVRRIQEATDRRVASDIRSAGSAISVCEAAELALGPAGFPYGPKNSANPNPYDLTVHQTVAAADAGCGNFVWMSGGGSSGKTYTNISSLTTSFKSAINVWSDGTLTPTRMCIWSVGGNAGGVNNWWLFSTGRKQAWSTTSNPATLNSCAVAFDSL